MKGLTYVLLALAVIGLGFWAYRENYATQAALREARALRTQIAAAEARLDRLHAEWAYLNRPDRLRDLVMMNFARLELLPLRPEAFAGVEQVAMPPTSILGPISSSWIVSSDGAAARLGTEEPL
ncbi:cell division protein FtsL [Rubellimicrobium sp. CFH 75288]|uniref:cell division protein FtsL n=1 Tax=Rubellimicrobium sp. CFH 75288 TaxID=2697034 RepID=UPI0014124E64|nr:cell division protein FtsL [Rubellimicrobium sp. CFH 75288]